MTVWGSCTDSRRTWRSAGVPRSVLRTLLKWRALVVVCRRPTILQAVLRDLLQYSRVAVVEADPGTVRRAADLYFDSKLRGEEANST